MKLHHHMRNVWMVVGKSKKLMNNIPLVIKRIHHAIQFITLREIIQTIGMLQKYWNNWKIGTANGHRNELNILTYICDIIN